MMYIKWLKLIFAYSVGNNIRVTYGFVGNPGFVDNSIFHDSTWHPKFNEKNVILQHNRFEWKIYNAVHAPNASYVSVQFGIQWICGQHANLWKTMASFVKLAVRFTKVLEYACYAVSGSVYVETAPLTNCVGGYFRCAV